MPSLIHCASAQVLLQLGFQQQAAVVVELGGQHQGGAGQDEQRDRDAHHQLDDGQPRCHTAPQRPCW